MSDWATFIHEMTHVWQGQNHLIGPGYMLNSLFWQAISDDAYRYTVGVPWGKYNVEQQAHLVEDWYALDAKSTASLRYPYIRDNILHPVRAWFKEIGEQVRGAVEGDAY
jgi:hypothetical protein